MRLSPKAQALHDLIKPAVDMCGVALWGVDFMPQGKRSLLRIFIDVLPGSELSQAVTAPNLDVNTEPSDEEAQGKGIGVTQCVAVTQQVGALLDVHNPIVGEYTLEVSSPGWDRNFYSSEQMLDYVGQTVSLRLITAVENRRKMTGTLISIDKQELKIQVDNQLLAVSMGNIDKANLVFMP